MHSGSDDVDEITTAVQRFVGVAVLDATTCPPGAMIRHLHDVDRVESWLTACKAQLLRIADAHAATGTSAPADELAARSGRVSRRSAQRDAARARTLAATPELATALAAGRIGIDHVDALCAATARIDTERREELLAFDAALAATATTHTPDAFARSLRRTLDELANASADANATGSDHAAQQRLERQRAAITLDHGIDATTGMVWMRGEFDPVTGQRITAAIDRLAARLAHTPDGEHLDARRRRGLAATALIATGADPDAGTDLVDHLADVALVDTSSLRETAATDRQQRSRPATAVGVVLVDHRTLLDGLHEHGVCELDDGNPIPPATARRLLCDAAIIPVVLGGDGQPLDVGRSRRTVTAGQRAALRSMYRTCAVDGCIHRFDRCEIHHLREWIRDRGPTDLDNLVPVCPRHHHLAHEARWRLELDPVTRELTVRLPDGSLHLRSLPDLVVERSRAA